MPNIGTCLVSRTLPLPRYMWTPQGRQGSKLRTARMMSMPLNLSGPVLLEDRRVLDRVFVGAGRAVDVARVGVPRRWRIGMIVGDLALADHDVVRQHAANRLMEAAADRLVGNLEIGPGLGAPGVQLLEGLLHEVIGAGGGVSLEVSSGPVALDGVAPLGIFHSNSTSGLDAVLGR